MSHRTKTESDAFARGLSARPEEMTAWVKKALAEQAASGAEPPSEENPP